MFWKDLGALERTVDWSGKPGSSERSMGLVSNREMGMGGHVDGDKGVKTLTSSLLNRSCPLTMGREGKPRARIPLCF